MRAKPLLGALLGPAAGALLLAAATAHTAHAARVTCGTGSGMAGQDVDVTLTATDLTGLGAVSFQFALTYTASVVTAVDVLEAGTLPGTAGWGDATFNVTSGRIAVSHAGVTALSGAGPLLILRFTINPALLAGGSTSLAFQTFTFNEGVPNDTTTNGSILVNATPQITVSPNSAEVVRGQTQQFSVSGSVTPPVTWDTTNPAVATISGTGLLTGVAPGAVRVFAVDNAGRRDTTDSDILIRGMGLTVGTGSAVQGNPGSVAVTVTDLTGLGITSGQFTVSFNANLVTPTGVNTAGTLLETYGPVFMGVTGSTFTVDFVTSAALAGAGTLCFVQFNTSATTSGTSSLILTTALFDETLPAKKTNGSFTVNPLPTITVSPENVTLLAGQTQVFSLSGSPTTPITWSTLNPAVATIAPSGPLTALLTAVAGGVTQVKAVDNVGATDLNTSVTVYDFQVSLPTVDTWPGTTALIPLTVDRDLSGLGIYSLQYTLIHNATHITNVTAGSGLVDIWGPPVVNEQPDRVRMAHAGSAALGTGSNVLQSWLLDVSPLAPSGTNIPLTLQGFLCNEGMPSGQVVNGLLRVRNTVEVEGSPVARLDLLPARPNPSPGATRIPFALPVAAARVTLAVHAADGRRVRTLLDGPLGPGRHESFWDGRDQAGRAAPAGLYFVSLEWDGQRLRRKLALLR